MTPADNLADVTITHKCGHAVTYRLPPQPRSAIYRTDNQIASMYCDACRALAKIPHVVVRPTDDGAEVAIVRGGYHFNDRLKESGYTYNKEYTQEHPRAWVLTCSPEQAKAEIAWMQNQDREVEIDDPPFHRFFLSPEPRSIGFGWRSRLSRVRARVRELNTLQGRPVRRTHVS